MLFTKKSYYLIGIALSSFFNHIVAHKNIFLKSDISKTIQDFPTHKDLRVYLNSLERIINFAYDYKDDLDLSFSFGLFLVNVNLKPLLVDGSLSAPLRNYFKSLLQRNDKILEYLNAGRDEINENHLYKISTFFINYASWLRRLKKLSVQLPQESGFQTDRSKSYPDWKTYVNNVDDIDKWKPSPQQSDNCMASLAETEENRSRHVQKCRVPEDCYKMLIAGTDFGYGLTHRLLFLLFARLGRGCTVLSVTQDQALTQRFCGIMYTEAEYIAYNGYRHVDLMLEQIALCALDGHAEFLRKSWFDNLLRYQTPHGCFGQHLPSRRHLPFAQQGQNKQDNEVNWKHDIMNGTCNGHVTAVAASSMAAVVRFILENN